MRRTYLLLFVAAILAAQEIPQGQSLKGVVPKNLAPVSTEVLRVKLPRPVERKLKNGVQVLVIENHKVPTITIDLVLPASSLLDPPDLPGVGDATADMLRL